MKFYLRRPFIVIMLLATALWLSACGSALQRTGAGATKTVEGIELVYVPGGGVSMGSPPRKGGRDEHPRHRVKVDGFWMGKYEVTQGQYEAVMGKNPSYFSRNGGGNSIVQGDTSRHPVEQVSWYNAVEFCNTLSRRAGFRPAYLIDKTKRDPDNTNREDKFRWTVRVVSGSNGFRLPYEAEWEYAVRGGTTTRYYWGNSMDVNYSWNSYNARGMTHPVGEKRPNAFGLYDMSGNVYEWCMDWYDNEYYGKSLEVNPQGPASGEYRVFRGGSWCFGDDLLIRSADRSVSSPDAIWDFLGFRVMIPASGN